LALATGLLTTLKFMRQSLGLRQQGTDFVPHRQFQAIRAHLVSGDLKLLSGGQAENVSEPLSVFFLKI
jgi:hypothetical protein